MVGKDLLRVFYRLFYLQFCDSSDQWKNTVWKVLLAIWEMFLHENNHSYNFLRLVANWLLSSFCSFFQTKNKNQVFTKMFIASRAGLQSHAKFYRLYKGIFLHVISVCIIVPWFHLPCQTHAVCHTSKSRYSHSVGISFLHNFRKRSLKCWKLA